MNTRGVAPNLSQTDFGCSSKGQLLSKKLFRGMNTFEVLLTNLVA